MDSIRTPQFLRFGRTRKVVESRYVPSPRRSRYYCLTQSGALFIWTWRHTRNSKHSHAHSTHSQSIDCTSHRSLVYHRFGNDTVSVVPFLFGAPSLYTRSMEVTRQVVSAGEKTGTFGKAEIMIRALLWVYFLLSNHTNVLTNARFWGPSVASAVDRDQWRKHRRISGPAFNNDTCVLSIIAGRIH
jgi:hypothetical protein